MFDHESIEKTSTRKWHQMSQEERHQELEMLKQSRYYKLFTLVMLQKKLNEII